MFGKDTTYVSEYTQFIEGVLAKNPELKQGQIDGRALLWDKEPINLDERNRIAASTTRK
ncbi:MULTISPECIES: DUF3460 family protein [Deefgea]|uniref:DUF3460 family protein n=1 Tax=Deefgea chitinilytica TaxID=570276 RepID=A0ABS2C7X8_9NEIS|nr:MULTISPECIES: DUF3460 family protein [Deefgea]MBM5570249.1 DUF3460 family protein [Deefgea chitinilytica]MBM9887478.1 DUF3460 family protein [Deefgea sp. CFH1-16]